MEKLLQVSNPQEVMKKGRQLGLDVMISKAKGKKYSFKNPITNKLINFGQLSYEDYTFHKDEKRREAFRKRNKKWATAPKYTASWASYNLLW